MWSYSCEVMWYHLKRIGSCLNFGQDDRHAKEKKIKEYAWGENPWKFVKMHIRMTNMTLILKW